jgi:hypothetical protein
LTSLKDVLEKTAMQLSAWKSLIATGDPEALTVIEPMIALLKARGVEYTLFQGDPLLAALFLTTTEVDKV